MCQLRLNIAKGKVSEGLALGFNNYCTILSSKTCLFVLAD